MKIASFYAAEDLRCEDSPLPEISEDEILLHTKVCGLCGTDVSKIVREKVAPSTVLGHEVAGDIAEVGKGVHGFQKGDRVVVSHHAPCYRCGYCRHGNYSQCPVFRKMNIAPGGFAEYVRVLREGVRNSTFRIPDAVSYEEAVFTEPLACCLRAIERTSIMAGDRVMVVGAGVVGLLHLQLALIHGASYVAVSDLNDFRLAFASKLGATEVINPLKRDPLQVIKKVDGADIVVVAVGKASVLQETLKYADRGGKILFFAECEQESILQLDPNLVYHSEITLLGSYSSTPAEQQTALDLITRGRIKVKDLITHRFPLENLTGAVDLALKQEDCLKILIEPAIGSRGHS